MNEALKILFNACEPLAPATEEYYVDCSKVRGSEAFSREVMSQLTLTRPGSWLRFLFSGHIGCGKSSDLENLRQKLETDDLDGKRFFPILLDAGEYLNDYDVTPTDILLSIVAEVAATLKDKLGIELKDNYFVRRFNELVATLSSDIEVSKGEIPLWGAKAEIKLLRQASAAVRQKVRDRLLPQMQTILAEIQTVFDEARLKLKDHQPKDGGSPFTDIVLMLDSLDRIKRVGNRDEGEESQRYLFIDCAPQWTGLNVHVIYTVPLQLVRSLGGKLSGVYGVDPFVLPMIKVEERGPRHLPYKPGRACLRQILDKRTGGTDLDDIFTHEALDWLLTYSGGHVRDLMKFVRQACAGVDAPPINIRAARRAIRGTVALFSTSIPDAYWPKLVRLERSNDQKIDNNDPDYRKMLEMVAVMEYINGGDSNDEPWYAVNPIVRDLTRFKAELARQSGEAKP